MIEVKNDLWQYLAQTPKPLIVYGMGDGADKLINALQLINREVSDFFASDGFVRGQNFHGKTVLSFADVKKKYGDFIILLSFGSHLPDVIKNISALDDEFELYAPDLPVCPDGLFTYDYYAAHKDEFEYARSLLFDDFSKQQYDDVLNFKLSGKIKYIKFAQSSQFDIAKSELRCYNYKTYVDAGAYNGDTVLHTCASCPNISLAYAFEPDKRSYKKLVSACNGIDADVRCINAALSDTDGETVIYEKGNRNTSLFASAATDAVEKRIQTVRLDTVIGSKPVDLIKMDVEGAELDAIQGAEQTILNCQPDMIVSLYHRRRDMYSIIPKIHSMYKAPKIRVRKSRYIPAWDFNMYLTNG